MVDSARHIVRLSISSAFDVQIQQGERRGGGIHFRRYKSICWARVVRLQFNLLVILCRIRNISCNLRRAAQVQGQINRCRQNQPQRRDQALLPRLHPDLDLPDPGEIAVVTLESEEEPQASSGHCSRWGRGRCNLVRVTSNLNNPVLRRSAEAASSSGTSHQRSGSRVKTLRQPSLKLPRGVDIKPRPSQGFPAQKVLSIDWHQVLDSVRLKVRR